MLDAFNAVFAKVMMAVRIAGSVTLLAGALVLAGALATAQRRRILEAVILKTLGATRRRILISHFLEYLLLAGATALFAVALGAVAAWLVVTQAMNIAFTFSARRRGAGAGAVDGARAPVRRRRDLGRAAGARRAVPAQRVDARSIKWLNFRCRMQAAAAARNRSSTP